jgi:hypothetical protein
VTVIAGLDPAIHHLEKCPIEKIGTRRACRAKGGDG